MGASGGLREVSCSSPTQCVAHGPAGTAVFDGTAWRLVPAVVAGANQAVSGPLLSCAPASACFLLDRRASAPSHVHRWNGSAWVDVGVPRDAGLVPEASLTDVSCPSPTSCVAVGTYRDRTEARVLAEAWNGTSWSLLPDVPLTMHVSEYPPIARVDCSAPSACVAATGDSSMLASWDGVSWMASPASSVPADWNGGIDDVACGGPRSCLAIGRASSPDGRTVRRIAEAWDGTRWSAAAPPLEEPVPEGPFVGAPARLTCATPTFCARLRAMTAIIAPAFRNSVQFFDGTSWAVAPRPLPPTSGIAEEFDWGFLYDIDCTAPNACVGVGLALPTAEDAALLVAATRWDGTTWTVDRLRGPAGGATNSVGVGVSCIAADRCLVLDRGVAAVTRAWVGPRGGWSLASSPASLGVQVPLAVSCHVEGCMIVGGVTSGQATRPVALSYRWPAEKGAT